MNKRLNYDNGVIHMDIKDNPFNRKLLETAKKFDRIDAYQRIMLAIWRYEIETKNCGDDLDIEIAERLRVIAERRMKELNIPLPEVPT